MQKWEAMYATKDTLGDFQSILTFKVPQLFERKGVYDSIKETKAEYVKAFAEREKLVQELSTKPKLDEIQLTAQKMLGREISAIAKPGFKEDNIGRTEEVRQQLRAYVMERTNLASTNGPSKPTMR